MHIDEKFHDIKQFNRFPDVGCVFGVCVNNRLLYLSQTKSLRSIAARYWSNITSNINFEPRFLILRKAYFNPDKYNLTFRIIYESSDEEVRKEKLLEFQQKANPPLNRPKKDIPFTIDEAIDTAPLFLTRSALSYKYIDSLTLSGKK